MTTFIDTCAVIALLKEEDPHHEWSVAEFNARKIEGPIIISDIVYGADIDKEFSL